MKKTQDAKKKIANQAAENKSMESPWRLAMKRLSRNKLAIAGLIFLGVMIVLCIVGPIVSPYSDITATDIANAKQPPSAQHWFGTDENGRDVFTRLLYGGRISMTVGLAATALQIFIGALLGCTAAYYGGVVDFVIMRVVDVIAQCHDVRLESGHRSSCILSDGNPCGDRMGRYVPVYPRSGTFDP